MPSMKSQDYLIFTFLVALFIRCIPEIIMFPYPVGYDTLIYSVYYSELRGVSLQDAFFNIILADAQPLLFRLLLYFGANILQWDPFIFLKIVPPLLYAFFGVSVNLYVSKKLNLNDFVGSLVSLLAIYHYSILRISWDLHRNILSFSFLVLFLTYYPPKNRKELWVSILFFFLAVISHQISAVVIFLTLCSILILVRLNDKRLFVLNSLMISFALVMIFYYLGFIEPFIAPNHPPIPAKTFYDPSTVVNNPFLFIPTSLGLFIFLFGPISLISMEKTSLGTSFRNILRNTLENPLENLVPILSFHMLVLSFSPLLLRGYAPPYWYRWMIIPPVFVFAHALKSIVVDNKIKLGKLSAIGLVIILFFSTGYILIPPIMPTPFVTSSMLQNTVPMQDNPSVERTFIWLNGQMNGTTCVVTPRPFYGWAYRYIENKSEIIFVETLSDVISTAENLTQRYSIIYTVWWTSDYVFNTENVPDNLLPVHRDGNIVVYVVEI